MLMKAKVESTFLDINPGRATIYLTISGDRLPSQKFGGTFCDEPINIISDMLDVCDASSWEDLPGKELLACVEDEGGKVTHIRDLNNRVMIGPLDHVTVSDIVKFKPRG